MKPVTSSGCQIVSEGKMVIKRGPLAEVARDRLTYAQMLQILGEAYPRFFPSVVGFAEHGEQGELILERVGENTLEALALCAEGCTTAYERVEKGLAVALRLYYQMYAVSARTWQDEEQDKVKEQFFAELVVALRATGVDSRFTALVEEKQGRLLRAFIASACHRDFGLHNIVASRDWSVRFIDPKSALAPGSFGVYGSAAYDLAKLQVSLERINEIRRRRSGAWSRVRIEPVGVSALAEDLIERGAFTEEFFGLCRLTVYAKYAACTCAFCAQYPFLRAEMERRRRCCLRRLYSNLTRAVRKEYCHGGYPH